MANRNHSTSDQEDHIIVTIDCQDSNEYKYLNGNHRQIPVSALLCDFDVQNVKFSLFVSF
jgi:hypothetical protein